MLARIVTEQEEVKEKESINIFIQYIYNKIKFNKFNLIPFLIHKSKIKKFKKNIYNGSPGFDILWEMADFIKIAEVIFCYDNSLNNESIGIYSSKKYPNGTNGFKIITKECDITIKMFAKSKNVGLEIVRKIGDCSITSLKFNNEEWENDHNLYDEMLLEQVIKIINSKILQLFDYCYYLQ